MMWTRLAATVALLLPALAEQESPVAKKKMGPLRALAVPEETVTVFALDAGPKLEQHAFSAVAALSSVVHFSAAAHTLRFVMMLTVPEEAMPSLAEALCDVVESAVGGVFAHSKVTAKVPKLRTCRATSFREIARPANGTDCAAAEDSEVRRTLVTLVHAPVRANEYPPEVSQLFELFCCSSRRYSMNRPELARSLGNHARFFAHLTLLPLGAKRALFLDADVLARVDVGPLFSAPLTSQRFVAAARRCAQKRARYQPRFSFSDELVQAYGLRSNAMLVNAGVLVVDLEQYCAFNILDDMKLILRKHVAGPPLWRDGNNQPPFTIAAAKHLTFVDPSWNVRLGDAAGQARVTRTKKRQHKDLDEDVCTRMLDDPWILHAHFNPCTALPDRLCPVSSSSSSSSSKGNVTVPRHLKAAALRAKTLASKGREPDACRCADVKRLTPPVRMHRGHHRRRHGSKSSSSKKSSSSSSSKNASSSTSAAALNSSAADDDPGGEEEEEEEEAGEDDEQRTPGDEDYSASAEEDFSIAADLPAAASWRRRFLRS